MAAGRFAADRQCVGAELGFRMARQPHRGRFAIVRTRRVGVLWRQPVFHADHRQAGVVGDPLQHRVLHVGGAEHPAAAVDVQIDAARMVRGDDTQRDLVAVLAGDCRVRARFDMTGGGNGPSPRRRAARVAAAPATHQSGMPVSIFTMASFNARVSRDTASGRNRAGSSGLAIVMSPCDAASLMRDRARPASCRTPRQSGRAERRRAFRPTAAHCSISPAVAIRTGRENRAW